MNTFTTVSGTGYITDMDGNIITICDLRPGKHPLKDGFKFTEVKNKAQLQNIDIPVSEPSIEHQKEIKIQNELREMAIERLSAKGDVDFKEHKKQI
jgi:hypothetical protein